MNTVLRNAVNHWKYVAPLATYPATEKDYDILVSHMNELLDIIGSNENHRLNCMCFFNYPEKTSCRDTYYFWYSTKNYFENFKNKCE